jgi:hypothetical protein
LTKHLILDLRQAEAVCAEAMHGLLKEAQEAEPVWQAE